MSYYANLRDDLPSPHQRKRIIFYAAGLKVYGLLPHLLNRRLHGEFRSSTTSFLGGKILWPTQERNWTVIPYGQSPENVARLLIWLQSGVGFEWGIAGPDEWDEDILLPNVLRVPPAVWHPDGGGAAQEGFTRVLALPAGQLRGTVLGLLPQGGITDVE